MTQEELKELKKDLIDLLTKHNCVIQFSCSGDTYGISDERMQVVTDRGPHELLIEVWGMSFSAYDLKNL